MNELFRERLDGMGRPAGFQTFDVPDQASVENDDNCTPADELVRQHMNILAEQEAI